MRSIFVILIQSLVFISGFCQSEFESSFSDDLEGTKWKVTKVVEIITGDTTVYLNKPGNPTIIGLPRGFRSRPEFGSNSSYVDRFAHKSLDPSDMPKGHWRVSDDNQLNITFDNDSILGRHTPTLSGSLEIISVTDSKMVLRKNMSRDGKWIRTFHLISWPPK